VCDWQQEADLSVDMVAVRVVTSQSGT